MNEHLFNFVNQHAHELMAASIRIAIESQATTAEARYILAAKLNGVDVQEVSDDE